MAGIKPLRTGTTSDRESVHRMTLNHQAPFIMTVDVEDWYTSSIDLFAEANGDHGRAPDASVLSNTRRCLELFARNDSKATFFILTTVAEAYPELIREIEREGHEIGVHGYQHRLVYRLTPSEFEQDLKKSLTILRSIGVNHIRGFRAPYWSITKKSLWALDILRRNGFTYDSSIFPIYRKLYGIPNAPSTPYEVIPGLMEYPPATCRFCGVNIPIAGGGYLRTLPYRLLKPMIRRAGRSAGLVFYVHPYELDPNDVHGISSPKRLKTRFYLFQQKLGRNGNPQKIEKLLATTRFHSFANAYGKQTTTRTPSCSVNSQYSVR